MANCLQKIPSENESRAEAENDKMGIPNYRERSRLNYLLELIKRRSKVQEKKMSCERALNFEHWKTFSENYKPMSV